MRAAVLKEYGEPLEIEEKDRPDPDEDEVVVETEACGICRSDWHVWQGDWEWMLGAKVPPGQILGHEPVGRVVETGNKVETVHEGDRVAVPFNLCDGTCGQCRNGHSNICESLLPLGFVPMYQGAFAEEFKVRAADYNTVKVPDGVDPVDIAGLGCRFSTAFHGLGHQADIEPGDWVAIHGCGGVGLSAVHIANALGGNVIAVDIMDEKLEKAKELGAVETVNAQEVDDVAGEVREITGGGKGIGAAMPGGADVSVDALGVAETCKNSVKCLDRRGQHVQIGLSTQEEGGQIPIPTDLITMREIEFIGSFGMQAPKYEEIFRMMDRGKISPGKIVSKTVDLGQVPDELEAMSDFETMGFPVINEF